MTELKGQVKWLKQPNNEDLQAFQRAVGPKYSQVSESIRRVAPGGLTCSMFCGGKNCKYDNPAKFKPQEMAIRGLYSSWVTNDILAMSRPSSYAVKEYNIIQQFKDKQISSIINLQHPGEHASCGFGLEPSGFSYDPQEFMDEDVFYYNYGWNDYGVRSLHSILDIVKVMDFAVSGGKVAVHCHAGLGRTGVVIACYLIFRDRLEADDAIHLVRTHRPKAIQTRGQIGCVKDFSKYLKPMRTVFSFSSREDFTSKEFTLDEFLLKQKNLLHGEEERKLRYVPKIVFLICQRLLQIADVSFNLGTVTTFTRKGMNCEKVVPSKASANSFLNRDQNSSPNAIPVVRTDDEILCNSSASFCGDSATGNSVSSTYDCKIERSRSHSLCQNLNHLGVAKISFPKCLSDADLLALSGNRKLPSLYDAESMSLSEAASVDLTEGSSLDDVCSSTALHDDVKNSSSSSTLIDAASTVVPNCDVLEAQFGKAGKLEPLIGYKKERRKKKSKRKERSVVNVEDSFSERDEAKLTAGRKDSFFADDLDSKPSECFGMEDLCKCLCSRSVESKVLMKIDRYKRKLNTSDLAWKKLEIESDVRVLGSLLWIWLEQLREPVLTKDQLRCLTQNSDDVIAGLNSLDRNARKTVECLLVTISKLSPISEATSQKLLRRLCIGLTKDKTLTMRSRCDSTENESHLPYSGNGQICLDFLVKWMESNTKSDSSGLH